MSKVEPFRTVAEVAKRYRVNATHVITWIANGDLVAINTSNTSQRPRWKISEQALADFEKKRSSKPADEPKPKRTRRPAVTREYV